MQRIIGFLLLFSCLQAQSQNVGIGGAPAASAQLDVSSTSKGFLMPRMTTAQRNAIASPAIGLQIFNLDDQCTDLYDGVNWIKTCGLKLIGTVIDPGHPTTNSWTQKASFGGTDRRNAVGFSIGNKGYVGTGVGPVYSNDFWEYDPALNVWTQKANFGGTARNWAVGFSIGSKGYIGTGEENAGNFTNDFWEYDPASNTWAQKSNFGGTPRRQATGFSIGGKGYLGTGFDGGYPNDFWEYDPATNAWTRKANVAGIPRRYAVGFSIGSKGYLGTGYDGGSRKDFWEYDPLSNDWKQKADFGGGARYGSVGFSIGNKGYVGTGLGFGFTNDFWEYDPANNAWTQKANLGGSTRLYAVGFSIGSKGYLGTGYDNNNMKDFWEYMDDNVSSLTYSSNAISTTTNTISDGAWTLANGTVYNANTGNVGIGTTSPTQKLEVAGTIKTTNLQVTDNAGIGAVLTSDASGNATWASGVWTLSNNNLYNANTGNVGIGSSSPAFKLTIEDAAPVMQIGTGTGSLGKIFFGNSNHGVGRAINISTLNGINDVGLFTAGTGSVGFITDSKERMRINASGDVSIGKTGPTTQLDVEGGIRTKYSGSVVVNLGSAGIQNVNLTIPALPGDWGATTTVVLVSVADGGTGIVQQAKITTATNILLSYNCLSAGNVRLNYIIFRL